jgi:hypothetical protein
MKQVFIGDIDKYVPLISNISLSVHCTYVGVRRSGPYVERAIVIRDDYDRGKFVARSCKSLGRGNVFCGVEGDSLESITHYMINSGFKVYEFDDLFEAMAWLAQQK